MSPEEVEANAFLRARLLKLWSSADDRRVHLRFQDGVEAGAIFRATDATQASLLVSQLETPLGVIPNSLLRQADLVSLHFPLEPADPIPQDA
mmetsp:Transcript_5933/g.10273  ORF Transcript_5933/g.10273 Transcript_5933/m.10273 type:complete len:92 (-) Transcript_5933:555-830(-)